MPYPFKRAIKRYVPLALPPVPTTMQSPPDARDRFTRRGVGTDHGLASPHLLHLFREKQYWEAPSRLAPRLTSADLNPRGPATLRA